MSEEKSSSYNIPTLYNQIEKCLAQSNLIFLLAELRTLSATGRIATKFDTLCIDSDKVRKTSAEAIAGIRNINNDNNSSSSEKENSNDENRKDDNDKMLSITPAHIMTVMLMEVINEAEQNLEDTNKMKNDETEASNAITPINDNDEDGIVVAGNMSQRNTNIFFSEDTNIGGTSKRNKLKQIAKNQTATIQEYTMELISDLNEEMPKFRKKNKWSEYLSNLSDDDNNNSASTKGSAFASIAASVASARRREKFKNSEISSSPPGLESISEEDSPRQYSRTNTGSGSGGGGTIKTTIIDRDDDDDSNNNSNNKDTTMSDSQLYYGSYNDGDDDEYISNLGKKSKASKNWEKLRKKQQNVTNQNLRRGSAMIQKIVERNDKINMWIEEHHKIAKGSTGKGGSIVEKRELFNIMKETIEQRDFDKLDIVKEFFKPNSISRVMAESTAQVVYLNDWYPSKECTYAICIDKVEKRMLVAFRGAITPTDWKHVIDSSPTKVINPIKDDYDGKFKHITLHRGLYRYLFRRRKDTGTTKYDEISNMVHYYGCREIGDDYRVEVTGHSLGAALSTIFTFFASTDSRFTKNAPIHCITFGCPLICGYEMKHSYNYQELAGKIRYCRVRNRRDFAPHIPNYVFNFSKYGATFYHVGLDLQLYLIRKGCFKALCHQPTGKLDYIPIEKFFPSYWRQIKNGYIFNMPIRPWKQPLFHTLVEHQARLLLMNENNTSWFNDNIEEIYKYLIEKGIIC